jgi:hypothetical protein
MTIGNEPYQTQEWNSTTYMVFFLVKDHHHMENMILSVINDALSSPLNVTAQMFVISKYTLLIMVCLKYYYTLCLNHCFKNHFDIMSFLNERN